MASSKPAKVEIPKYEKPIPPNWVTPWGSANYNTGTNTYNFAETPDMEKDRIQMEGLRRSILSTIGVTGPERDASLNKWKETYYNELYRSSVPQLEQTLFARGMGGSEMYKGALTDLLTKLASQSVLGAEDLRTQDEALKLSQLGTVGGQLNTDRTSGTNLTQLAADTGLKQDQLAQNLYLNTLPFMAKYTGAKPSTFSQIAPLAGLALGALTGGMAAPAMSMTAGPFAQMGAWVPWSLAGAAGGGLLGSAAGKIFG